MGRPSQGPWFRKHRKSWWVTIDRKQVCLGKDENIARQKWLQLYEVPEHMRGLAASRMMKRVKNRVAEARKAGKVSERAAAMYLANRLGLTLSFGCPRMVLLERVRSLPFSEAAADVALRLERFNYFPDGWEVRDDG